MSGMRDEIGASLQDLKRKRVFRIAASYAVVAFVVLQLAEITFPAFGLADAAMRGLVILSLIGFVVTVGLVWLVDIRDETRASGSSRLMQGAVIAALFLVAGFGAWLAFLAEPKGDTGQPGTDQVIQEKSIAVLPFTDLSPEGDQAYFGDGIAEELLNVLTKIEGLRVAARTSSFAYKGKGQNVQTIGRELGVATVLEGSIRKSRNSDRVRITAQLIDSRTGFHVWSETYDRQLDDIFVIQDEITANIVDALKVTLLGQDQQAMGQHATRDFDAFDLYLEGRHELRQRTEEAILKAKDLFEEALEIDPDFVRAYTGLADSWILLASYGNESGAEAYPKAELALAEALKRDDTVSEVWASLGLLRSNQGSLDEAEDAFTQALALDDQNAMAWLWYGNLLGAQRKFDERIEAYQQAYAIEPMSRPVNNNLGYNLPNMGRFAEARPYLQRMARLVPDDASMHLAFVANTYMEAGDLAQAVRGLREVIADDPENSDAVANLARTLLLLGRVEAARTWAERAEAMDPLDGDTVLAQVWTMLHAGQGADVIPYLEERLNLLQDREQPFYIGLLAASAYVTGDIELARRYFDEFRALYGGRLPLEGNDWTLLTLARFAIEHGDPATGVPDEGREVLKETLRAVRERVEDFGFHHPFNHYLMAAGLGMSGQAEQAMAHLRRAVDGGLRIREQMMMEPIMAPLRGRADFQSLMAEIEQKVEAEEARLAGMTLPAYTPPPERVPVAVDRSLLEDYAGHYQRAQTNDVPVEISLDDDGLVWRSLEEERRYPLKALDDETFYTPLRSDRYTFVRGDDGEVTHLLAREDGAVQRYKRIDFERPEVVDVPLAVLERYTGTFEFEQADETLSFYIEDGRLFVKPRGDRSFAMYPRSEDTFFLDVTTLEVRFVPDGEGGEVNRALLLGDGSEIPGVRRD